MSINMAQFIHSFLAKGNIPSFYVCSRLSVLHMIHHILNRSMVFHQYETQGDERGAFSSCTISGIWGTDACYLTCEPVVYNILNS